MNVWIENIIRYIVLLLLQVLLVNNMQFMGVCSPCIYLLFLLLLPVGLPRWVELIIGFLTGLVMDIFCNTLGIHAAACVLVAYLRPLLIRNMVSENDRLTGTPTRSSFGLSTFVKFVVILVLVHHSALFILLAFSWHNWWVTLLQIVVSSLVSVFIFIGQDFLRR